MTPIKNGSESILESSRLLAWAIILGCVILIVDTFIKVPYLGAGGVVVDFDAFYIAGQMVWAGDVAQAYSAKFMAAAQNRLSNMPIFMPWTYPPFFDLLVAAFPLASRGVSYVLFISSTFLAYILVIRCLSGGNFTAVLLATMPALIITIRIGQNGFLTGTLAGLFCLAFQNKRAVAGVPLGFMLIKPHLSLGMLVLVTVSRRWKTLAVTACVAILSSGLATLVFGLEVWPAFLAGAKQASGFLERGIYPLHRMTSIYAALHSFGTLPAIAIAVQIFSALIACGTIVYVRLRGWPTQRVLGITILATLAISPYNYDYDMAILGVGLALLSRDILENSRPIEKLGLLVFAWLTCGWGLLLQNRYGGSAPKEFLAPEHQISLGGIGYVLLLGLILVVLKRLPINSVAISNGTKLDVSGAG